MLTILLSEVMDAETKKRDLAENHDMIMTEVIEGGVAKMLRLFLHISTTCTYIV